MGRWNSVCSECGEQYINGSVHKCADLTIYDVLRVIVGQLNMTSEAQVRRMLKAVKAAEDNSLFGGAGRFKL